MENLTMLSYRGLSTKHLEDNADVVGDRPVPSVWREGQASIESERKEPDEGIDPVASELRIKDQRLEDMSAALKVLLQIRAKDRKELEQSVSFNVRHLAEPWLDMLKNSGLNQTQKSYIDTLRSILREIASPLSRDLMVGESNLTPSQVRIANLVKLGQSSKEIADVLNLSVRTIETHRRKIRTKLGLSKDKTNLQSYLHGRTTLYGG